MTYTVPQSSPFMFEASDKSDPNFPYSCLATDKFIGHQYLETYEKFAALLKDKAKNVLEIGIWAGHSMLMWHDFFTQAQIYGIDTSVAPSFLQKDRITTYQHNAYDADFVEKEFVSKNIKFDLIIDDGPHTPASWDFFVKHYLKLLNKGGVAIIEDIPGMNDVNTIRSTASTLFQGKIYMGSLFTYNNKYDEHIMIFTF